MLPLRMLLALLALTTAACEPDPPDRASGRDFYMSHGASVDALETELGLAVRAIPWLEQHEPDCDPEPEPPPGSSALDRRLVEMHCSQQRLERTEARDAAISDLERDRLPSLLAEHGAMSARLSYRRQGSEQIFHLGAAEPAPPTARDSAIRAKEGLAIGERRVGWGLYSNRWTDSDGVPHGTEDFVRGYEVAWHLAVGDADVEVSVFYLE